MNSWSRLEGPGVGSGDTTLLIDGHTHSWKQNISVYSAESLRRECSFFFIMWLFSADSWRGDRMQREAQSEFRRAVEAPSLSAGRGILRETISTTTNPRATDYQQEENYFRYFQPGGPVQRNQQNSGVPKKKEADKIEFEKFPNSNSFVIWKMNFKSEVCWPSSSFPTEAIRYESMKSIPPGTWTK